MAFDAGVNHSSPSSHGRTDRFFASFVHVKRSDLATLAKGNAHGVRHEYPSKLMDYSMDGSSICPVPSLPHHVSSLAYSLGERVWSQYGTDKDE